MSAEPSRKPYFGMAIYPYSSKLSMDEVRFEWDSAKNMENVAKHGVGKGDL
jgi:hypothetical protein